MKRRIFDARPPSPIFFPLVSDLKIHSKISRLKQLLYIPSRYIFTACETRLIAQSVAPRVDFSPIISRRRETAFHSCTPRDAVSPRDEAHYLLYVDDQLYRDNHDRRDLVNAIATEMKSRARFNWRGYIDCCNFSSSRRLFFTPRVNLKFSDYYG